MYVDVVKLAGKKQNINPMWKILMNDVDLGEPPSFLDHVYLVCTQTECQTSKDTVDNYRHMFESRISAGVMEKFLCSGKLEANISSWSMAWKVTRRNVWSDIANWRTKQFNSCTKWQLHVLTIINSRKKKWDPLENCLKFANRLF